MTVKLKKRQGLNKPNVTLDLEQLQISASHYLKQQDYRKALEIYKQLWKSIQVPEDKLPVDNQRQKAVNQGLYHAYIGRAKELINLAEYSSAWGMLDAARQHGPVLPFYHLYLRCLFKLKKWDNLSKAINAIPEPAYGESDLLNDEVGMIMLCLTPEILNQIKEGHYAKQGIDLAKKAIVQLMSNQTKASLHTLHNLPFNSCYKALLLIAQAQPLSSESAFRKVQTLVQFHKQDPQSQWMTLKISSRGVQNLILKSITPLSAVQKLVQNYLSLGQWSFPLFFEQVKACKDRLSPHFLFWLKRSLLVNHPKWLGLFESIFDVSSMEMAHLQALTTPLFRNNHDFNEIEKHFDALAYWRDYLDELHRCAVSLRTENHLLKCSILGFKLGLELNDPNYFLKAFSDYPSELMLGEMLAFCRDRGHEKAYRRLMSEMGLRLTDTATLTLFKARYAYENGYLIQARELMIQSLCLEPNNDLAQLLFTLLQFRIAVHEASQGTFSESVEFPTIFEEPRIQWMKQLYDFFVELLKDEEKAIKTIGRLKLERGQYLKGITLLVWCYKLSHSEVQWRQFSKKLKIKRILLDRQDIQTYVVWLLKVSDLLILAKEKALIQTVNWVVKRSSRLSGIEVAVEICVAFFEPKLLPLLLPIVKQMDKRFPDDYRVKLHVHTAILSQEKLSSKKLSASIAELEYLLELTFRNDDKQYGCLIYGLLEAARERLTRN